MATSPCSPRQDSRPHTGTRRVPRGGFSAATRRFHSVVWNETNPILARAGGGARRYSPPTLGLVARVGRTGWLHRVTRDAARSGVQPGSRPLALSTGMADGAVRNLMKAL